MIPDRHKKKAAWFSICVACVAAEEGVRTVAYKDPVGIPTACFGETQGVKMGQTYTLDQCKEMLGARVEEFGRGVDRCVTVPLPPARKAALVSFSYNVGTDAFCRSTLVKKMNAGETVAACNELLRWTTARGIKLPGLVKRREQERDLCLQGTA